jgi:hypothetical protein
MRLDLPPADRRTSIGINKKKPDSLGAGLQKNQDWIQPID